MYTLPLFLWSRKILEFFRDEQIEFSAMQNEQSIIKYLQFYFNCTIDRKTNTVNYRAAS